MEHKSTKEHTIQYHQEHVGITANFNGSTKTKWLIIRGSKSNVVKQSVEDTHDKAG